MKQCIRQEVLYNLRSKISIAFIIINVLLCVSVMYSNYSLVISSISDYTYCKTNFEKNIDVVLSDEDGEVYVTNKEELNAVKENVENGLYSVSPKYSFESALITMNSMGLLIMALYGGMFVMNDKSNKIFRIKAVRNNKTQVFWAKHIVMIISGFVIELITAIVVCGGNYLYFNYFMKKYNLFNDLSANNLALNVNWMAKIVVMIIFLIVSLEVGYLFASIVNKSLISFIFIVAYSMFLPNLGKYDVKSCLGFLVTKYYDCYGSIKISTVGDMKLGTSISIITLFVIVSYGINYLISKNRSAY